MVAKYFNDRAISGLFAGTPPLEALRSLVSEAGTISDEEKGIMINDVARAFFEAKATRKVCIELQDEDRTPEDERQDNVGLLQMNFCGTRDAATNWQEEVAKEMAGWGFVR